MPKMNFASGKHSILDLVVLFCFSLLSYLSVRGIFTEVFNFLINDHIRHVDEVYLQLVSNEALETLEVISEIKMLLALIQSSVGEVSFIIGIQVQLGQLLHVLVELVDRAWLASLAAIAAIEGMKLLLDLAFLSMSSLLSLVFICLGFFYGTQGSFQRLSVVFGIIAKWSMFLVLFTHFVVPLSIFTASTVSHHFFASHRAQIHQEFQTIHRHIPKHKKNSGMKERVEHTISSFEKLNDVFTNGSKGYSRVTVKHIVYSFIEFFVIPLVLLLLLSQLSSSFLRKIISSEF